MNIDSVKSHASQYIDDETPILNKIWKYDSFTVYFPNSDDVKADQFTAFDADFDDCAVASIPAPSIAIAADSSVVLEDVVIADLHQDDFRFV